jgi:hypothetical protein
MAVSFGLSLALSASARPNCVRRSPNRNGARQTLFRHPDGLGREGASGRLQRSAAGARRRPSHRRSGPHRRLPQHHGRDDPHPPQPDNPTDGGRRLPGGEARGAERSGAGNRWVIQAAARNRRQAGSGGFLEPEFSTPAAQRERHVQPSPEHRFNVAPASSCC